VIGGIPRLIAGGPETVHLNRVDNTGVGLFIAKGIYLAQVALIKREKTGLKGSLVDHLRIVIVVLVVTLLTPTHFGCRSHDTIAQVAESRQTEVRDVADLTETDKQELFTHVENNGQSPVDYVVSKFEPHDLVFLGEAHQIRENCQLVADLIEPLHSAGVHVLASEFFRSRHTTVLNKILTADQFDKETVIDLLRDNPWPTWGFREYADIVEAAWRLNSELPAEAPRFRIIGMDSDWSQYDLWFETKDRRKVFEVTLNREEHMTQVLRDESLDAGHKALVHVGYTHTVTCHGIYMATVLRKEYGDRLFQVALHREHGFGKESAPLTLLLEETIAQTGGAPRGFDIVGSPFASLVDKNTIYSRMKPGFGFEKFAEGYVLIAPVSDLHPTDWIDGFITEESFDKALAVAVRLGWVKEGECENPGELNAKIAERF